MLSFKDLMLRIPELCDISQEVFRYPSYCIRYISPWMYSGLKPDEVGILNDELPNDIHTYQTPFVQIEKISYKEKNDPNYQENEYTFKSVIRTSDQKLFQENYYSSFTGKHCYVTPLVNGINDIVVIHFIILYALSIIVRYYPKLLISIENEKFNDFKALIEQYLFVFDKVIVKIMLERIENIEIRAVLPGTMNASFI